MNHSLRVALSAWAACGLLGSLAVATPSLAAEQPASPFASASTLLAAVTAPMLAVDRLALSDDPTAEPETTRPADETAPRTLAALVDQHETSDVADAEQRCLAASVYYEAKGEPLAGQLAVAETIMNRAASGRFPASLCGVVRQPGQFSFVRSGQVPAPRECKEWRQAVAIARIAQASMWRTVAPAALYFHAARVQPRWGGDAKRIAQLGNHVFYR